MRPELLIAIGINRRSVPSLIYLPVRLIYLIKMDVQLRVKLRVNKMYHDPRRINESIL